MEKKKEAFGERLIHILQPRHRDRQRPGSISTRPCNRVKTMKPDARLLHRLGPVDQVSYYTSHDMSAQARFGKFLPSTGSRLKQAGREGRVQTVDLATNHSSEDVLSILKSKVSTLRIELSCQRDMVLYKGVHLAAGILHQEKVTLHGHQIPDDHEARNPRVDPGFAWRQNALGRNGDQEENVINIDDLQDDIEHDHITDNSDGNGDESGSENEVIGQDQDVGNVADDVDEQNERDVADDVDEQNERDVADDVDEQNERDDDLLLNNSGVIVDFHGHECDLITMENLSYLQENEPTTAGTVSIGPGVVSAHQLHTDRQAPDTNEDWIYFGDK
ncbi:predicted protein [Nematostella vectensis]|uniref:Uncharacterized protein n=1 Tax=Nematostella vectensis TaxID=45351 RepID=A7RR30_NEMVE|nr:predicted protein [Nematostella vectensis]|eukprot:XP_001638158.1 predicted protein [Nematostella vectensis]